ncbi:hypothetical protein [Pseudomonas juntendi]|uniref:Uncharacterized protein n=1 Tax=Pseudomonas juntendi TaxID=2666183 RepID=A0A7W2R157_9PSED|nr:hypothetical protein [Pseudomonas juntendi]MBA6129871.1 hypothetical protein [Pseudomonas juntendi]MBA6134685.1 hypothetical protein [Pseudomonas juntendi]MBA6150344.1 hypothetical protein [Pseudomonas juntendi]
MWDFWKKRREAEQERKVERVLEAHETVLALCRELDKPVTLADELAAVKASFERGRDEFLR